MVRASTLSAQEYIKSQPHLVWYVKDYASLSDAVILESILNYGTWQDVKTIEAILTPEKIRKLYQEIANKKRTNLKPKTKNYFDMYYRTHAS